MPDQGAVFQYFITSGSENISSKQAESSDTKGFNVNRSVSITGKTTLLTFIAPFLTLFLPQWPLTLKTAVLSVFCYFTG